MGRWQGVAGRGAGVSVCTWRHWTTADLRPSLRPPQATPGHPEPDTGSSCSKEQSEQSHPTWLSAGGRAPRGTEPFMTFLEMSNPPPHLQHAHTHTPSFSHSTQPFHCEPFLSRGGGLRNGTKRADNVEASDRERCQRAVRPATKETPSIASLKKPFCDVGRLGCLYPRRSIRENLNIFELTI